MSRFLRGAAVAALTLTASAALATAAGAQSYGRLVVFGDSLSDNGNLYIATGRTQPPSPPYFQGRFSTGPVFTELLGFNAANFNGPVNGSINLAFGGARTDSSATPLGMRNQLATYLQRGGTFGSGDLVSILGGANNIFQGLPAAGASGNPTGAITPVALSAATDINFIVNSVAGAGAGTILVTNLPKLSLTPQFRNTAAAPLADFAVGQFNGALLTQLSATAAARPGTNIIVMDLFKVGDTIAANPGAFGITNVTDACFNGVTVCADSSGYFYFDGVHPTALGHRLLARLANDYLYYGDIGAHSAVMGETAYRHREDALATASHALSGSASWAPGTAIVFGGQYDQTDTDARGTVGEAESTGYGVTIGLEHSPSANWRVGLSGNARKADVDVGTLSFGLETFGLDAYAGWRSNGMFVNAAAGIANDSFDMERATSLAPIVHTGATDGVSVGARAQAGFWFGRDGGLAISPRAAITWASSDVDGFFEQGVAAQYDYRDRTVDGVTAEATLRAEGDFSGMGFFIEGGYRDSLDDGFDPVRVGIQGNPAQVLSRTVEEPFGGQVLASAGVSGDWGPVRVSAGYRGRYGDNATSHMGGIQLTLPLE